MSKFKVGDKVKVSKIISDSGIVISSEGKRGIFIFVNKIGTIINIKDGITYKFVVKFQDMDTEIPESFREEELKRMDVSYTYADLIGKM